MSSTNPLAAAAAAVANISLNLQPGERVVLITDDRTDPDIGNSLHQAFQAAGASVDVLRFSYETDDINALVAQYEPLSSADVVVMPVSQSLTYNVSIAEVRFRGGRVLSMPRMTRAVFEEIGTTDIEGMLAQTRKLADQFANNPSTLELRSRFGTQLTVDISGCKLEITDGVVAAGENDQLPAGIVSVVGRNANGVVVIDGPVSVLRSVDEPIRLTIENKTITKIEGGEAAAKMASILDRYEDRAAARNCPAEIGIGTNPSITYTESESFLPAYARAVGVIHVGFGDDHLFHDGTVVSPLHGDFVLADIEVWLDGVRIDTGR